MTASNPNDLCTECGHPYKLHEIGQEGGPCAMCVAQPFRGTRCAVGFDGIAPTQPATPQE